MRQLWSRAAPLTGVLCVICSLVATMLVLRQPLNKDPDAKITSYFADQAHRGQGMVGFYLFAIGTLFLLAFLAELRARLLAGEGEPGHVTALVFGAGVASVPLWSISTLLAYAPNLASADNAMFRLDPNTFRLLVNTAYFGWVAAAIVTSLVMWGTSAVALRTGILPRWYAIAGIVAGILQPFGLLFLPFVVWWLWLLVTSVLLMSRRNATMPSLSRAMASAR